MQHGRKPRHFLRLIGREMQGFCSGTGVSTRVRELAKSERRRKEYLDWITRFDTPSGDATAVERRLGALPFTPHFSVVMPVFNPPGAWLERAIASVRDQWYPHWQLCIADDCSTAPHVREILERHASEDERLRVVYREVNGHISVASNTALALASGDFVALLDHDDVLAPHALLVVAEEIAACPNVDLLYTDEDKIDENEVRSHPHFKPDWNPDLFLSHNYVSHLGVYRTSLVREIGGFRAGFEGSQDYDLALRVIERTDRIRHIPFVLYHWRAVSGSTALGQEEKVFAPRAARRAVAEHLERTGQNAQVLPAGEASFGHRVRFELTDTPLVSIIITTGRQIDELRRCVRSIRTRTDYPNYEMLIVGDPGADRAARSYLANLGTEPNTRVVKHDRESILASSNNLGATASTGSLLAFLSDGLEVISEEWLSELVSHALRRKIGAVGAMLYHPDDTIHHAGMILGVGGVAAHAHHGEPRGIAGCSGRASLVQNLSALSAACLVMRKADFDEIGGFDTSLLFHADVDLCLRIGQKGYRVVWTPYAELYCHGSAACADLDGRGDETALILERWGDILGNDPAYNPNFGLERRAFEMSFPPRVRRRW
jgi:glycosyltransferase involved in cell wall biosynthesis